MTIRLERMFGPVYLGLLAVTFVACFEDSPPGIASGLSSNVVGGPLDEVLGDPRTLGPIEIDYPREPPLYETDDAALVEAIKASDGYVFVGLKDASTDKLPDRPKTGIATRRKVVMPGVSAEVLSAGRRFLEQSGVDIIKPYRNYRFVGARIDPESAPAIRSHPFIDYIEPSPRITAASSASASSIRRWFQETIPNNIQQIRADDAWSISRGAGVNVVVIDTGTWDSFFTHNDLPQMHNYNCFNMVTGQVGCPDEGGGNNFHGTGVAGVALARQNNGVGVAGVAPDASLISYKYTDLLITVQQAGFNVAAAIDLARQNGWMDVVNMSVQFYDPANALAEAVAASYNAGDLLVAAAGNTIPGPNNHGIVAYPGRYTQVIAVTGVDDADGFAHPGIQLPTGVVCIAGSRFGDEAELSAPFVAFTLNDDDGTDWHCGTSFAAPAVSGVAALVWSQHPTWTNAQVRSHLQNSVVDLGNPGWDEEFGYGRIDACTAVGGCLPPPQPTANISGPNEMRPGDLCQWDGSASGGTPPYSYSWSGLLSGSGSSIMGSPSSSGVLKLTVTDAASQQDTHNRYVEVTSSAPDCFGGPG